MNKTEIQWTDSTWNPVRGCSRVSEGCRNCYAEGIAARFSGAGDAYEGFAKMTKTGPQWTGLVEVVERHLYDPLVWKTPRRVFVNSMSDLFHERLEDKDIADAFAVMAASQRHTFQVLTKRHRRMREFFMSGGFDDVIDAASDLREALNARRVRGRFDAPENLGWPLPNVWLGVSVENQKEADERIPALLETPAAVRFISAEPLLGPVDLKREWIREQRGCAGKTNGIHYHDEFCGPRLDWVIVGGESGRDARPMDLQWARDVVNVCRGENLPVFVKQLGSKPVSLNFGPSPDPNVAGPYPVRNSSKGGDPSEWPQELRVREFPEPRA
jgi:protein gp37